MKKTIIMLFALLGIFQAVAQNYDKIPYLTEGVKFVNERVIVNNGDTTSMYYTYEIAAITDVTYDETDQPSYEDVYCCKYYTSSPAADGNDNIISRISRKYAVGGDFIVFDNEAYWKIEAEGRNMTCGVGFAESMHLYDFLYGYENLLSGVIYRYVSMQEPPRELAEENFVEADPVMIDGRQMQRIAYIDEDGEPLAYIVRGIGFDSYDMGDLLTPFTRKPDPDADYQEWWGLSHVVKDGQIIYKGMRYRHGAFTGIDEVATEQPQRPYDPQYYNLMGQPVGKDVPTTPGIYIHNGKKIIVR